MGDGHIAAAVPLQRLRVAGLGQATAVGSPVARLREPADHLAGGNHTNERCNRTGR